MAKRTLAIWRISEYRTTLDNGMEIDVYELNGRWAHCIWSRDRKSIIVGNPCYVDSAKEAKANALAHAVTARREEG